METVAVHVGRKKDIKIAVTKRKNFLYIKGYRCAKNCSDCPLHVVGEDLENLNKSCKHLDKKDLQMELKLAFNVSEKISFT